MTKTDSSPSPPPRTPDFGDFTPRADGYVPSNAYLLASCANLAYETPGEMEKKVGEWKLTEKPTEFQFLGETEDIGVGELAKELRGGNVRKKLKGAGTEGFIARGDGFAIVCFRGTEELTDFLTDANAFQDDDSDERGKLRGRLHRGFRGALSESLRTGLKKVVGDCADQGLGIWVTGHSLGGALATLAAAELAFAGIDLQGVYTFGQPRVCCPDFARAYDDKLGERHFRFVNNNDIVTEAPLARVKLPDGIARYRHVGQRIYIKTSGQLSDDIGKLELTMDRAAGYVEAALEGDFADGVSDHSMVHYLDALDQNYGVDPTAEPAVEPPGPEKPPADEPPPPKEPPPPRPLEAALKTEADLKDLLEKKPVEFVFERPEPTVKGKGVLDEVAGLLSGAPADTRFRIEGHTDSSGDAGTNLKLSLRRAEKVRDYLVEKGLDRDRFDTEGFGETRLLPKDGKEDPQKSRRVEIKLL